MNFSENNNELVKEAVGIFKSVDELDAAVEDLESSEFARQDISYYVSRKGAKPATDINHMAENPNLNRKSPLRYEEKMIGLGFMIAVPAYIFGCAAVLLVNPAPNATLLTALFAGSLFGALLGAILAFVLSKILMKPLKKQIQNGGLLLFVRTGGPRRETIALDILKRNGGRRVHLHEIA
ncbi:MAG: hypothetical protein ACLFR0_09420 [Alphaproteobacteria bacterium]